MVLMIFGPCCLKDTLRLNCEMFGSCLVVNGVVFQVSINLMTGDDLYLAVMGNGIVKGRGLRVGRFSVF